MAGCSLDCFGVLSDHLIFRQDDNHQYHNHRHKHGKALKFFEEYATWTSIFQNETPGPCNSYFNLAACTVENAATCEFRRGGKGADLFQRAAIADLSSGFSQNDVWFKDLNFLILYVSNY